MPTTTFVLLLQTKDNNYLSNLKLKVMKKLLTITAAVALFFSTSAFTLNTFDAKLFATRVINDAGNLAGPEVSKKVVSAFQKQFGNAKNVNWSKTEEFYFATFNVNAKDFSVAYSEAGEFISIARTVELDAMPLAVTTALKEQFKEYILPSTVNEIILFGETNYYLIAEGKKTFVQLKCSPNGSITVEKKIKKKVSVY